MRAGIRFAQGAAVAAILAGALAGQAAAATTIGSSLGEVPNGGVNDCSPSCTFANGSIAAPYQASGGATAPASGVITSWTLRTAAFSSVSIQARLRVITNNTATASSATVTVTNTTGLQEFPARVPITTGQRIGIDIPATGGMYTPLFVVSGSGIGSVDRWGPALPDTGTGPSPSSFTNAHIPLQARIEPDADGDGYGDETQDRCPTDAATSGPCPIPLPETTITLAPKKVKGKKATIEFSSDAAGATFECALDEGGFKPCSSPAKLKKLKPGRHNFSVRAIASGVVDTTPAETSFKVKKKKHKHG